MMLGSFCMGESVMEITIEVMDGVLTVYLEAAGPGGRIFEEYSFTDVDDFMAYMREVAESALEEEEAELVGLFDGTRD